jgi:hypothetical protein
VHIDATTNRLGVLDQVRADLEWINRIPGSKSDIRFTSYSHPWGARTRPLFFFNLEQVALQSNAERTI